MTKDTFVRGTDDTGACFYQYAVCEAQKNHSGKTLGSSHLPQARMYGQPGDPLCPISAMDNYISLLHPELHWLWQRPNDKFIYEESQWYSKMVLGHNKLSHMMKDMCKAAGLSQPYTNHCTRATVSKTLGDASFDRSDIIKGTAHRDTCSLDTYIGEASSSKKRALSDTLAGLTCQVKPRENIPVYIDQPQDPTDQTDPIGQDHHHPDEVILNINDHNMSVYDKSEFADDNDDLEIDMIQMSEKVENNENFKRPFIFNNCIFKNATFN